MNMVRLMALVFLNLIVPIKNIYNLTTNIGWRKIINTNSHKNFLKIKENSHFYFCHSYYAEIINEDEEFVLSELKIPVFRLSSIKITLLVFNFTQRRVKEMELNY